MNVVVRRMTLEDVPAVHEIDLLSFSLPWPERSFRFEMAENPAARGWVAEADGRIAAMLVLWFIVDEAHVATIATHPEFRRQGIGEKIFLHALREVEAEMQDMSHRINDWIGVLMQSEVLRRKLDEFDDEHAK